MSTNPPGKKLTNLKDKVRIKFVKKAGMFCQTTIKDGKQSIEWISK